MKKLTLFFVIAITAITLFPATALAGDDGWDINMRLLFGTRQYGTWDNRNFSADVSDLQSQNFSAVEADFGKESWPANIWVGYAQSASNVSVPSAGIDLTSKNQELVAGARLHLPLGFYVSGGPAFLMGKTDGTVNGKRYSDTLDPEVGLMFNAGIGIDIFMFYIGLDARALTGTNKRDYAQVGLALGLSF